MEAIVLAGGLGTRLASVIQGMPKVMAPVGNQPFLALLLRRLEGLELAYAIEDEPLGTGGATLKALSRADSESVFVLNGDTYVDIDYAAMLSRNIDAGVKASIAVAEVDDCTRFGRIAVEESRVVGFAEKGKSGPGKISAGVYVMNRDLFAPYNMPAAFSLESDFFVPYIKALRPLAFVTSGYFIDIGIPEDLARAQSELQ